MASFREADVVPPVDYSILHDTRPDGRIVGTYQDQPIWEAVIDDYGRRYLYTGLAPRFPSGKFDCEALQVKEFIVLPGLAYRLEAAAPRGSIFSMARNGAHRRGLTGFAQSRSGAPSGK